MPDNVELIQLLEYELDLLINKAKKSGLGYYQILLVCLDRTKDLMIQAKTEQSLKLKRNAQ